MPSDADETRITAALVLRTYQYIVDHGEREHFGYSLRGVTAQTDVDGYGVTLSDGLTTVRVLFHNKVHIDAPRSKALQTFRRKLTAIDALRDRHRQR